MTYPINYRFHPWYQNKSKLLSNLHASRLGFLSKLLLRIQLAETVDIPENVPAQSTHVNNCQHVHSIYPTCSRCIPIWWGWNWVPNDYEHLLQTLETRNDQQTIFAWCHFGHFSHFSHFSHPIDDQIPCQHISRYVNTFQHSSRSLNIWGFP